MTQDDEFISQLEGYLDEFEGITPLPDAVRSSVRSQLRTTRQGGLRLGWVRHLSMSIPAPARYGLAAALVVSAAVLGASFFGRGIGGPPATTPFPAATPGELPTTAALEPGSYVYANPYVDADPIHLNCMGGCPDFRTLTFTMPDGWTVTDGLIATNRNEPNEVAFSMWTPDWVYADPCHWQTTPVIQGQDFGPFRVASADAQGMAKLANQAGRGGSAPIEVTFGRQPNAAPVYRIELSVPDIDINACDQGEYRSWTTWQAPDRVNSHHVAGQIDMVYVVDLDRHAFLIDASHRVAATAQDLTELQAILDSIVIDRSSQ